MNVAFHITEVEQAESGRIGQNSINLSVDDCVPYTQCYYSSDATVALFWLRIWFFICTPVAY